MERSQQFVLFLSGILVGGLVVLLYVHFGGRDKDEQLKNAELRLELVQQQVRMLEMQVALQETTIADFKAILADTASAK